tara:strand:- start:4014 stop:4376 length:363 start_codon:yes stop_codon:yes gene_type:complete
MEEKLITFETAKLAKDKGFDMPWGVDNSRGVFDAYTGDGKLGCCVLSDGIYDIQAPTQSLLQQWLRDERGLSVLIDLGAHEYVHKIYDVNKGEMISRNNLNGTYEEALERGLLESLNKLK